jgi:hypothetical protein
VDDINGETRTGWSVVGIGEAYEIVDPTRLAELAAKLPQSWTTYPGAHTVSIPLQVLTGRNLVLAGGIAGCLSTRPD